MRRQNSSQFAEDLRDMRAQARELARQQEDIARQLEAEAAADRKSLADSPERKETLDQLARQKERVTNLVDRATELSQQAETAEPLVSSQLYDAVRKFSQDNAANVKELQDRLLNSGMMTRRLLDQLQDPAQPDSSKLLDLTSELLRQDLLPQANLSEQRTRAGIDSLKNGVERAAQSVLGDDTEALRLAQKELEELGEQLKQEIARAGGAGSGTNQSSLQASREEPGTARGEAPRPSGARGGQNGGDTNEVAQAAAPGRQGAEPTDAGQAQRNQTGRQGRGDRNRSEQANSDARSQSGEQPEGAGEQARSPGAQRSARGGAARGSPLDSGGFYNSSSAGGAEGGDISGSLGRALDQVVNDQLASQSGPILGEDFIRWSDRLREVEEMLEFPDLRNEVAAVRDRARVLRQEYKRDRKKPDWAVVRLKVMDPLAEVRKRIADELARRDSKEALVPIDRDPVPGRYSELVRRYYEELGKDKK